MPPKFKPIPSPTFPTFTVRPLNGFRFDRSTEGWELARPGAVLPDGNHEFELVDFLRPDVEAEVQVTGAELLRRASKISGIQGQAAAEELWANRDRLPGHWKSLYALAFPDTHWLDTQRRIHVPILLTLTWDLCFWPVTSDQEYDFDWRVVRIKST